MRNVTPRERFHAVMNFQPVDRLPMVEWAAWWDQTLARWHAEGLPQDLGRYELCDYFGLESYVQDWFRAIHWEAPKPREHQDGILPSGTDGLRAYAELRPHLFQILDRWPLDPEAWTGWAERHSRGEIVFWFTVEGFFWLPRTILGVERHLLAFYEEPELIHQINDELADWVLRLLEKMTGFLRPDFMTFAEDMSYNNGPMLSREHFQEFLQPYYRRVIPELRSKGIRVFADSDGDVTSCLPWFREAGVEGLLPLERQAGFDLVRARELEPEMLFLGAFDKMVLTKGPEAIYKELERLRPVAEQGGYVPSMDHQTPPGVSLAQYREYLQLLRGFCESASIRGTSS